MSHQGQERSRIANLSRWKTERGALLRGRRPSVVGSTFEEDLALFGRQVREETGGKDAPGAAPVSAADLPA